MEFTRLKIFMMCIVFIGTLSLLFMLHYSVAATGSYRNRSYYVGSRTKERGWMNVNNTSQGDKLNYSIDPYMYTPDSSPSKSSFAPEANRDWTTDRDKLIEESKELCPSGSKQGLYIHIYMLYLIQQVKRWQHKLMWTC